MAVKIKEGTAVKIKSNGLIGFIQSAHGNRFDGYVYCVDVVGFPDKQLPKPENFQLYADEIEVLERAK